jgi:hypothetical protein
MAPMVTIRASSSGRAPIRGISWALAPDIAMMAAIIGR